jgi:hypothetical protein
MAPNTPERLKPQKNESTMPSRLGWIFLQLTGREGRIPPPAAIRAGRPKLLYDFYRRA